MTCNHEKSRRVSHFLVLALLLVDAALAQGLGAGGGFGAGSSSGGASGIGSSSGIGGMGSKSGSGSIPSTGSTFNPGSTSGFASGQQSILAQPSMPDSANSDTTETTIRKLLHQRRPELPPTWEPNIFPRTDVSLPIVRLNSTATPKTPLIRRREQENRGQDDVGDVPAVKATVAAAGGTVEGKVLPAWQGEEEGSVVFCNQSLRNLRAASRSRIFAIPRESSEIAAEQNFLKYCLSPIPTDLEGRVARLQLDGKPDCTVFFLTAKRGITARHCLFTKQTTTGTNQETLVPNFDERTDVSVEMGEISRGVVKKVVAIFVPIIQRGLVKLELKSKLPLINMFDPEGDLVGIELDSDITPNRLPAISWTDIRINDKILLPAFHYGTYVEERPADTGIRYQSAGYCQVMEPPRGRCFRHACSTTPGASGAPVLIEREQDGAKVLKLAGIHTSGSREESGCGGNPELDNILNFGVALTATDLQFLLAERK